MTFTNRFLLNILIMLIGVMVYLFETPDATISYPVVEGARIIIMSWVMTYIFHKIDQ